MNKKYQVSKHLACSKKSWSFSGIVGREVIRIAKFRHLYFNRSCRDSVSLAEFCFADEVCIYSRKILLDESFVETYPRKKLKK